MIRIDTRWWLANSFDIFPKSTVTVSSPNHYLYDLLHYSCADMHYVRWTPASVTLSCRPSFVQRHRENKLFSKLQNHTVDLLHISLDGTHHSGGYMCAFGHDVLIIRQGQWSVCVMRVEAEPSGSNPERNAHEWNVICTYLSFHKRVCVCARAYECVCYDDPRWLKWNMNKAGRRGCVCACCVKWNMKSI